MSPALRIQGLNCAYPGTTVLHDVNVAVESREFFIVIGPNGSGKTTLIKTIARLLPPSGGEIRIGERPLNRLGRRELARRLAYVPQNAAEDTPFSVEELVLNGQGTLPGRPGTAGENTILPLPVRPSNSPDSVNWPTAPSAAFPAAKGSGPTSPAPSASSRN